VTFNPTSPGTPAPATIDSSDLYAVACPSAGQCTAVDGFGHEVTFDPTAPGAPVPVLVDPGITGATASRRWRARRPVSARPSIRLGAR
jgi:hypothetical protein